MRLNSETVARASSRRPWTTIGIWVVLVLGSGFLSSQLLGDVLSQEFDFTNEPESVRAQEIVDEKFGGNGAEDTEFVIVQSGSETVEDPEFETAVRELQGELAGLDSEILAQPPVSYYDVAEQSPEQAAALVSRNGRATLITVALKDTELSTIEELRDVAEEARPEGFTVLVAGQGAMFADFSEIAEEDLRRGETIGGAVALIILIVVFASLVAPLLPIAMAIFGIALALGMVSVIGQLVDFNLFVTNMISMIGLAVGIDYSLFIVSRYREERKKGLPKSEAIGAAGATANRAVFFSGLTVVIALLGMFIIPATIFRSLAAGAILVTVAALAASMTLLPAILSLLGDRINWPRFARRARVDSKYDPKGGFWDRLSRGVMARPIVYLLVSVIVLGGLGSFYFQLDQGTSQNVSQLPDEFESKQAFLTLEREFSGGVTEPASIIATGEIQGPAAQAAIGDLREAIAGMGAFAPQTQVTPSPDGEVVKVDAFFRSDPSNETAFEAIRDLRGEVVPEAFAGVEGVEVLVGGNTAFFTDFLDVADTYQPIVVAFVLGLSFILLTVVFRSIVVPVKAIIMNLLSVGAAYGAITLVFQEGFGIGFFNNLGFQFQQVEGIEPWIPLFLFSVLFGLSMDYHVFLLSRIREEYDRTGDNTEAVAYGLRTTAGIITGAALIMVAVFVGFAAGRLGPLQQMGFGLAVAVLMDATIVRSILVPASMRLLGDWNWYLPRWLRWLPDIHVEGTRGLEEKAGPEREREPVGA